MPKKKPTKTKKNKSIRHRISGSIKSFYDTRTWTKFFLTLLVFWGLIWCGQVAVERYRFYDAEKKLDKLAAELQKQLGSEYEFKKERSCGYSSVKFGRGDRSCSLTISSPNLSMSYAKASEQALIFKKAVENNKYFDVKILEKDQLPFGPSANSSEDLKSISFNFYSGRPAVSCSGAFIYSTDNSYSATGFTCHGFAKMEYFPVGD